MNLVKWYNGQMNFKGFWKEWKQQERFQYIWTYPSYLLTLFLWCSQRSYNLVWERIIFLRELFRVNHHMCGQTHKLHDHVTPWIGLQFPHYLSFLREIHGNQWIWDVVTRTWRHSYEPLAKWSAVGKSKPIRISHFWNWISVWFDVFPLTQWCHISVQAYEISGTWTVCSTTCSAQQQRKYSSYV